MKITIETREKEVTIYTDGPFTVLVDDELLLEHAGEKDLYTPKSANYHGDPIPQPTESSSLFSACPSQCCKGTCDKTPVIEYIHFEVPSSSFIESIRWWSEEESIGTSALEINFKDERYITYSSVPKSVVNNWIAAIKTGLSAGRYYNQNIKGSFKIVHEGDNQ